jgi:predicted transcriptional regulator
MKYIFSNEESICFNLLSKSKGLSVVELAQKSGLYRPVVYKVLEKLQNEGFITTSKKTENSKRLVYIPNSKIELEKSLERKREEFEKEATILSNLFPQNGNIQTLTSLEDIMNFYDTLAETLGEQECYFSFGSSTDYEMINRHLSKKFRTLREKKNLWSYVVATQPPLKQPRFSLAIKQLSISPIPPHCSWVSYSDVFAFLNFEKEYGYVITDKTLAEFQQAIIKAMYEKIA